MGARFFLTSAIIAGAVSVFVAFYLKWAVRKIAGYYPDYFVCYLLALAGCLANLFLPFAYQIAMAPYRKLPPRAEFVLLEAVGFLICVLLYTFWIRSPEGHRLPWLKAAVITLGQFAFFVALSYWI